MPIRAGRGHPRRAAAFLVVLLSGLVVALAHADQSLIPGSYTTEPCGEVSQCPISVGFYTSKGLNRIEEFRSSAYFVFGGDSRCVAGTVEADVDSIPLRRDHTFEFHGQVGTGKPGDNPIAQLDVVGRVESSVRATGTYRVRSNPDPECDLVDVSGSWVAVSKFSRPLTYPKPLTLKFSKKGRPLPLNLLFNYVNAEGHPLTAHIVKNVRCGKLRIQGQIARFRKPRQGCPFRQHATYTVSNAKRTSKPARINVNRAPASR